MANIVIGMDESEGAAAALRWATREAELRGWTPIAVLAWGLLDQHHTIVAERFDPSYGETDALDALRAMVESAIEPDAAASVKLEVVCDLPAQTLIDAAEYAELLVVGARGLGGFRSLLLGSVSEDCLHHAGCPVAVVHADQQTGGHDRPEHIVVGVDGSDDARGAVRWALDEGRARGATVQVVHAWQPPIRGGYAVTDLRLHAADPFAEAGEQVLEAALAEQDTSGVPAVERTLAAGGPASALLAAAENADLVVVGSRGVGGLRGLLLGSVSRQVARHSRCPVVVVRPRRPAPSPTLER